MGSDAIIFLFWNLLCLVVMMVLHPLALSLVLCFVFCFVEEVDIAICILALCAVFCRMPITAIPDKG